MEIKKILTFLTYHLLILIIAVMPENYSASAADRDEIKRILYINSYHRGYKWSDGIEQGLRDRFKASGKPIDFYIEYLDTQRFPESGYLPAIADILDKKHLKINYDVIVVSDNNAFEFAVRYRERIFPGKPLVFCGYNSFRPEKIKNVKNVTGVNEEADFAKTISMALEIHKGTDTMVFVTSDYYTSGKINHERVERELIPAYSGRYKIIQFKNLYLDELEKRLPELTEHTLVFVFGAPMDNFDRQFIPSSEYYRRLAAASIVPAYSFWDYILDTGMTGGNIITGPDQGRKAAELVLMILDGTPAENIPVVMQTPVSKIFDYNALKRFGISESELPGGSTLINKPDTFYHKYKVYVLIGSGIFIILTVMVIILVFLLRKSNILTIELRDESEERRKVMVELQRHKDHLEIIVDERTIELRRTYDALNEREILFRRMFDMHSAVMYLLNPDTGSIIDMNQAALEFYGYSRDEMHSMDVYAINQLSKDVINEKMLLAKTGDVKVFEFRHRLANGDIRDVEVHAAPIPYQGEEILFGVVHDITDRKIAEGERERLIVELKEALSQVRTLSGMLPICASCKKIRNDSGYWEQIETYIGEHSDAEFTHGLCPDCIEKLYPGLKKSQ